MRKKILGTDLEVSAVGLGCRGMNHAYGVLAYQIILAFEIKIKGSFWKACLFENFADSSCRIPIFPK